MNTQAFFIFFRIFSITCIFQFAAFAQANSLHPNFDVMNTEFAPRLSQPGNANLAAGEFGDLQSKYQLTQKNVTDAGGGFLSFPDFPEAAAWDVVKAEKGIPPTAQVLSTKKSSQYTGSDGNSHRYLYSYAVKFPDGRAEELFFATEHLTPSYGWRKVYIVGKIFPIQLNSVAVAQSVCTPSNEESPPAVPGDIRYATSALKKDGTSSAFTVTYDGRDFNGRPGFLIGNIYDANHKTGGPVVYPIPQLVDGLYGFEAVHYGAISSGSLNFNATMSTDTGVISTHSGTRTEWASGNEHFVGIRIVYDQQKPGKGWVARKVAWDDYYYLVANAPGWGEWKYGDLPKELTVDLNSTGAGNGGGLFHYVGAMYSASSKVVNCKLPPKINLAFSVRPKGSLMDNLVPYKKEIFDAAVESGAKVALIFSSKAGECAECVLQAKLFRSMAKSEEYGSLIQFFIANFDTENALKQQFSVSGAKESLMFASAKEFYRYSGTPVWETDALKAKLDELLSQKKEFIRAPASKVLSSK